MDRDFTKEKKKKDGKKFLRVISFHCGCLCICGDCPQIILYFIFMHFVFDLKCTFIIQSSIN